MSGLGLGLFGAACLVLGACDAGQRSPEGAVRAFAEAAAEGDRDQVWRLLGPRTRAEVEAAAQRASELSGKGKIEASQLLEVGWVAPRYRLDQVSVREQSGDHATVEVRGRGGEREAVECVHRDGGWRVELPPAP